MANMFLGKPGIFFTYLGLSLYLFGDLAIYSTTVPKSAMNMIWYAVWHDLMLAECWFSASVNASDHSNATMCHESWPEVFSRHTVYLICVVVFLCMCLPMVYIGMTKTKHLQLFTTVFRWLGTSSGT